MARHLDYKETRWVRIFIPDHLPQEKLLAILEKYSDPFDIEEEIIAASGESPLVQTLPNSNEYLCPADNGDQETMMLTDEQENKLWSNAETKSEIIRKIRELIAKHGMLTTAELEMGSSPVYSSAGKDQFTLIERFRQLDVVAVSYVHEQETDEEDVPYEDLSIDVLKEILEALDYYDYEQDKLMESCKD